MPVAEIKPGMIGEGRTVFAGSALETFEAEIIGTLANITGPGRHMILARLSGGPVDTAGVMAGMSGSPVYIDGRLIGAVSYALGAFPKEPLAGITPIGEMLTDVDQSGGGRPASRPFAVGETATPDEVFAALDRLFARAAGGAGMRASAVSAAPFAEGWLRPIGAALSIRGFDDGLGRQLAGALGGGAIVQSPADAPAASRATASSPNGTLRPGDPVGASLMRGDYETGATGTVTFVDGDRVYAFGHPFLGLGPTRMPMTQARVYAVLPSLQSSMKIADLGPVIGTVSQDRATAIGGTLGTMPDELRVALRLVPASGAERTFQFHILQDPALTPLFAYVSVLNVLTSYSKQSGPLTIAIDARADFGADGRLTINDVFSGDQALVGVANAVLGPMTAMMNNDFKSAMPGTLDVTLNVGESEDAVSIERVWLDTTRPVYGGTHTVHVMLRNFRGGTVTRDIPVTMPASGAASLTLFVGDAPSLAALEDKEIDPNIAHSLPELLNGLNRTRRNNRLYVRLLADAPGIAVRGRAQTSLPNSTRSVLDADASVSTTAVSRAVVGATEEAFDRMVRGSRQLPIVLHQVIK